MNSKALTWEMSMKRSDGLKTMVEGKGLEKWSLSSSVGLREVCGRYHLTMDLENLLKRGMEIDLSIKSTTVLIAIESFLEK